jgi:hypothetical protein
MNLVFLNQPDPVPLREKITFLHFMNSRFGWVYETPCISNKFATLGLALIQIKGCVKMSRQTDRSLPAHLQVAVIVKLFVKGNGAMRVLRELQNR